MADGMDFNLRLVGDTQDERAGILHAPLDVGDHEIESGRDAIGLGLDLDREGHFVAGAMDEESAVRLKRGRSGGRECSFNMVGTEDDVRELGAFQNALVHPLVTAAVAAHSARSIDNQLAGSFTCSGIVMHFAAAQLKRTMDRVQCGANAESYLCLGRIERKIRSLRAQVSGEGGSNE